MLAVYAFESTLFTNPKLAYLHHAYPVLLPAHRVREVPNDLRTVLRERHNPPSAVMLDRDEYPVSRQAYIDELAVRRTLDSSRFISELS